MNKSAAGPIWALCFAAALALIGNTVFADGLSGSRPNIILVMTDDQGMGDLSGTGNSILQTPQLDQFAEKSTRLTDFHVSPTCAPTRAAMMSGRRPFEVGVTHTILQRERLAPEVVTFPQALKQAGYQTGLFGKWHLGDEDEYLPQNRGFDEVLMHGAGGIGQYQFGDFEANTHNTYFDNVLLHNDTIVQTQGFCTDVFFDAALAWIGKQHEAKQPFFAYISLNAPHGPMLAPEEYKKRFLDAGYDENTAARYGMVENIDHNFGRLVAKLEEWQALENTLVIFMTDNGMAMRPIQKDGEKIEPYNAGMKGRKNSAWEGGTHVPAFWYWKGALGEGVDVDTLTAHVDLYRTFTDLAGAKVPESPLPPGGRSLVPLLADPNAEWQDRKLFVHKGRWHDGRKSKTPREANKYNGAAVRTERWRLVYSLEKGEVQTQLSDISSDPGENTDVSGRYPEIVAELGAAYDEWWASTEPFLVNEKLPQVPPEEMPFTQRYQEQLKETGIPLWSPGQETADNNGGTTYYVSPLGDNDNPGTSMQQPMRTVQHAVDGMKAGDTLVVLDGLYAGELKLKPGITIRAWNPRKAVFSGLAPLELAFEPHEGGIFRAEIDHDPKQLFYNDQPMTWAQWPNLQWPENWVREKKWVSATDGTGPGVLTSEAFADIAELNLEGGYCFLRYGKGNSCYSRPIESFDGTKLLWNDKDFYTQKFSGEDGRRGSVEALKTLPETHVWHPNKSLFFLAGALDLLDVPGEWFAEGKTLYFYPPDGTHPSGGVLLGKSNDYCIEQDKALSGVTIEGIDFLACSVRLGSERNSGITFRNVQFTYTGGELLYVDRVKGNAIDKPIHVAGTGIRFERCLFAGALNSALSLSGADIVVENSVFMENNRHANFESRAMILEATGPFTIRRNTFFNNHSDAIMVRMRDFEPGDGPPEIAWNNIFNGGKFNSDVSGIYMPTGSQHWAEVHHNWIHNMHGNAFRLDLAGKQLNLHHNVFWASKRGINLEGYGEFNVYNNTDVHNHETSLLTRNVLNHANMNDASFDKTFPPIDDWNVLNNLVEGLDDRVGPREKKLFLEQFNKQRVFPERPRSSAIPVVDRGAIQGNLTGERRHVFTGGELSNLDLVPVDSVVNNGVEPSSHLAEQGVTHLDSFRGAYGIGIDAWRTGSDWMPYGLEVPVSIARSEAFAKHYYSVSIVPELNLSGLPAGRLGHGGNK
jgi:arylsulfatase